MTSSCWQRAGMGGIEMGIDVTAAMARIGPEVEAHAVRLLLFTPVAGTPSEEIPKPLTMSPEAAAMNAMAARRKDMETERSRDGGQE